MMALTALEIYKHLPRTNCGECGNPTCLAFAMQLSQKKVSLDQCPKVTEEGRAALEGAAAPPIRLITIGVGDRKLQIGNETVLFRHEQTFVHPAGVAAQISDSLDDASLAKQLADLATLVIERVGTEMRIDLVAVKADSGNAARFADVVAKVQAAVPYPLVLIARDPSVMEAGLKVCAGNRPLLYAADAENWEQMAALAKDNKVPLAVVSSDLTALNDLTPKVVAAGVQDLVIGLENQTFAQMLQSLTIIRRLALKKSCRSLGYPVITFATDPNPYQAVSQTATYVAKYAGIVVMDRAVPSDLLSLLTMRYNIYTDPQKPIQVKPGVYEVREPNAASPVLLTTNFSLTYYTVEGDVDASRVPAYIVVVDTEGTSVLTAWAADKLNVEKVATALNNSDGIAQKVNHRKIIIPGLVAVMAAKLKEQSGWEVVVGPRESAAIPRFLKSL
jgi:acetyl-CoA decarbonylase/synthase complex subunit gamma